MARKQLVVLEDDLDGSSASETLTFGFRGASYEIDLSDKNIERLEHALGPFLDAARRTGGHAPAKRSTNTRPGKIDNKAVRAWAASNDVKLSDRGRIPASVIEQYRAAGN